MDKKLISKTLFFRVQSHYTGQKHKLKFNKKFIGLNKANRVHTTLVNIKHLLFFKLHNFADHKPHHKLTNIVSNYNNFHPNNR